MSAQLDQFSAIIKSYNFLVLDTETTGLKEGEICQIAIVSSSGVIQFDTLVKTVDPIPSDATAIHGITDAMVADAPTWADLVEPIAHLLKGRDVIVYNAKYDRMMMHKSSERHGLEKTDWKAFSNWHCAMEVFAEVYGEFNEYYGTYRFKKLSDAADYYGINTGTLHTALDDVMLTLQVATKIAYVGRLEI